MYIILHLNYSVMEKRDTNLRHSSLLPLDLWIQSSLRSQVKWVRLSQYSLYGCLLASPLDASSIGLEQTEAEILKQKKKVVFPVFLVKLKLQVLEASGDKTPPQLLHQNMQPKCCYLFNQKERSKGFGVCPSVPSSRHSFSSQQLQLCAEFLWTGNLKWVNKDTHAPKCRSFADIYSEPQKSDP